MSNRVTLAQLDVTPIRDVHRIPLEQIEALLEDVAELQAFAKRCDEKLTATLDHRYGEAAAALRKTAGKDAGTVRVPAGDRVIVSDLPKHVIWNQAHMQRAVETVRGWGENVSDYVDIKISVPERKYAAWPESIRKLFEPARTVKPGKPTYAIEPAKKEAA